MSTRQIKTILILTLSILLFSYSLNAEEEKKGKSDKQDIKCVTLTVKIEDEKGHPIPNCESQFRIHGGYATGWWDMDANGETSQRIYETNITSYVDIRGPEFQTLKRLGRGIQKDMIVIFVLHTCP